MFFDRIADTEINAVTDNPLVFAEAPQIVSAGTFMAKALPWRSTPPQCRC
jgi:histidine ammonia-lyase